MSLLDVDDRTDRNSNMFLGEDAITQKTAFLLAKPNGECSILSYHLQLSTCGILCISKSNSGVDHGRS